MNKREVISAVTERSGISPEVCTQVLDTFEDVFTEEISRIKWMAVTGARMLSVEEASRYAGGMDDPARLVSSFAGVASNVSSNGISIHGNAPHLLQWRMEDVEIPNPNHFADLSVLGGGILSSLSSQVLGNSDFFTGAFPAEYGNAVSGVFDMKLRNGNNRKFSARHTNNTPPCSWPTSPSATRSTRRR